MINKELVRPVGSIGQDNLIAHINPKAHTTGIYVKAGAGNLKRGTVLYRTADGSYDVYGNVTESESFTGDGTTTAFTVAGAPAELSKVTVGGTAVTDGWTYSGGTLTFTTAPDADAAIVATYGITVEPSIVLTEDADASEAQATAVGYRTGCFNRHALIFADGYTMTNADVDCLRKYGIILSDFLD